MKRLVALLLVAAVAAGAAPRLNKQAPPRKGQAQGVQQNLFPQDKSPRLRVRPARTRDVTEKSFFDYFKEAHNRLTAHPNADIDAAGFKFDPKVVGEWMSVVPTSGKVYGVIFNGYTFQSDGTGILQRTAHTLRQNNQLLHNPQMDLDLPFAWGVEEAFTDKQEPVTLIRVGFEDGSWFRMYYGAFENGNLGFVLFDEQKQVPSTERNVYYPAQALLDDWARNKEKTRLALVKLFKARQEMQQQAVFNNMMITNQMNHFLFMNTMNIGFCGSISCAGM